MRLHKGVLHCVACVSTQVAVTLIVGSHSHRLDSNSYNHSHSVCGEKSKQLRASAIWLLSHEPVPFRSTALSVSALGGGVWRLRTTFVNSWNAIIG